MKYCKLLLSSAPEGTGSISQNKVTLSSNALGFGVTRAVMFDDTGSLSTAKRNDKKARKTNSSREE